MFLSPIKVVIIVALALIVLGPDKLPEVARQVGSGWHKLKRLQERIENEVREVVPDLPSTSEMVRIARSPVNMLNQLAERMTTPESDETVTFTDHPNDVEPVETEVDDGDKPAPRSRPRPTSDHNIDYPVADPSLN